MHLAELGPFCLRHVMNIGLFGSKSAASRKLTTQVNKGRFRFCHKFALEEIGIMRAETFYTNRLIKQGMERHEAYVMEVIMSLWPCYARTGYDVDQRFRSDGDIEKNGIMHRLELDASENMSREQVQGRWKTYKDCLDSILIITMSPARAERLRKWTDLPRSLVTTIQALVAEPNGKHWTANDGRKVALVH